MSQRLPMSQEDILYLGMLIENYLPSEKKIRAEYHRSRKGYTAVRFLGSHKNTDWFIDCYKGSFFVITVPGFEPVTTDNPFSMIAQVKAFLTMAN